MKFDINEAIRDVLDFFRPHWRPSLAKYIVRSLMPAGLISLSVPLWVEIANWVLVRQNFFPDYRVPLLQPNYLLGACLIGLSVIVYLLDEWLKKITNIPSQLNEISSQVADEITTRMRHVGFTAQHLQDEKIEKLVQEIEVLRFFGSFPKEDKATDLAESIIDGELSGGTPKAKARALALLARYLCAGERAELARKWLSISKQLCKSEEAETAQIIFDAIKSKNVEAAYGLLKARTPSGYAAFIIVKRIVEGNEDAFLWFESAGLSAQDLDNDGKISLVSALLSKHQWEKALNFVETIDDESFSTSPKLAQLCGFTFLVNAIKANELRESALTYIPFAANTFPLADDSKSIALRKRCVELFKLCSNLASQLGAEDVSSAADNYVLWLELRGSETHERAKMELQSYFVSYTQKTLKYLPLAFAFQIDIDFESIEKEVNRQTALSHDNDPTLGLARFVLAQTKKSFPAVVEYIARHRNQMEGAVNPIAIGMLEIEVLARSGLVDDAEQLLQKIKNSELPDAEIRHLQNIIELAKGKDPVALAISHYQETKATNDLSHLVNLLERGQFGEKFYTYCRELFDHTGQESDAIRICNAASSLGKFSDLHQFLSDRMDIVKRSEGLQIHWAWSLFRKGELNGAHEQIARLKQSKTQRSDLKALEINLSIFGGDWESLSVFVEDSWNNRQRLTAEDLLQAAQLAKAVSPGRARQILEFCTGQYPEDPVVLASSYFTATTMGWEDSQETSEWLKKAIILSNDDGPLHRASLEDLKEMIAETRKKNERLYKAYFDGDAPIFTVAELLNRTMSDFYLIQPLENKKTKDIRRKNLIPIFHSARPVTVITGRKIAIDASSALVAENIGLLSHLLDCFEEVVIPHSFMRWLFEEKQKVAFHQPSQIEKAKYFERLVSDGRIFVFHPKKINNPELALNVGDELAFFLEEAHASPTNESQALVVCSYPVYKIEGSFKEVEADLSPFNHCLISCSQLVKKLQDIAVITEAQCLKALSYLRQHEKEWPTDLEVAGGTKLFLDSLSIAYLMIVDMLDKLSDAGFEVYVFKAERDKYKSLINYDSTIRQADLKIENIRKLFSMGLTSGKVVFAEMPLDRRSVAASKNNYARPTEEIFEAVKVCDAALIDDRFMNRHRAITIGERSIPIFTSLDFAETLHHKRHISIEQKLDVRTSLRESGFEFVGISYEELDYHLNHSVMVDGEFKPTRQLRLLRESLLLTRISGLVQLPRDSQWLQEAIKTIAKAIKAQWSVDISIELSRARSCWLYDLIGYREWAQAHQIRGEGGTAYWGEVLKVNSILIAPDSLSEVQKEAYKAWLDEFVLAPLREIDPWSFKNVVNLIKQHVKEISKQSLLEKESDD